MDNTTDNATPINYNSLMTIYPNSFMEHCIRIYLYCAYTSHTELKFTSTEKHTTQLKTHFQEFSSIDSDVIVCICATPYMIDFIHGKYYTKI